jgi:hypothetical protein
MTWTAEPCGAEVVGQVGSSLSIVALPTSGWPFSLDNTGRFRTQPATDQARLQLHDLPCKPAGHPKFSSGG